MASGRVQPQGDYAKNMYRCPAEWLRLTRARRDGEARAARQRAESEFLSERIKRRFHIVERRIDVRI
jgi:hypothetical protein